MEITVYHGGSRQIVKTHGYTSTKKKDRFQSGVGLYTTPDIHWAAKYGRSISALTIVLDKSNASHNVFVPVKDCLEFVLYNCSRQDYNLFQKGFSNRNEILASQFQHYLNMYIKKFHLLAQVLNDWLVVRGVDYTGAFTCGGELVLVHNFGMIKSVCKSTETDYPHDVIPYEYLR